MNKICFSLSLHQFNLRGKEPVKAEHSHNTANKDWIHVSSCSFTMFSVHVHFLFSAQTKETIRTEGRQQNVCEGVNNRLLETEQNEW